MTEVQISEFRSIAASAFIEGWVDDLGVELTPVAIETDVLEDDETGAAVDPPAEEWARFKVLTIGPRPGSSGPQVNIGGIGNRKFERGALATIQVYTRKDGGSDRGDELADIALEIFEAKNIDGLKFEGGRIREKGVDRNWRVMHVEIPFYYTATK